MDITLACEEMTVFCKGRDLEAFKSDRMLQLAVERQFEIIGEAMSRLERIDADALVAKIPEYRRIIGFRNVIAHGYDIVDDAVLWDFVTERIPQLLEKVKTY